ncbi:probable mediator of RNA polymerase II transcription subunit 19b isoform X6 [Musa acuminata AAA Group]|uniref:probable mediator of RNA polymerase II transcription subunit 19b isoform X6 n=1 Tax=Musa acuminata AAA Group TaxID=214697 RepID=UPI0031D9E60C
MSPPHLRRRGFNVVGDFSSSARAEATSAMLPKFCGEKKRGPRELTGAVDLINHYKLLTHHDFFCKRNLPLSILDTHYLHNVVGETEIRKGEGMELDQLFHNAPYLRESTAHIQPFDLELLGRQKEHLQFLQNQKEIRKTRIGSTRSTKTKIRTRTRTRTRSIRSINIVAKIEARIKTKIKKKRRIKVDITIQEKRKHEGNEDSTETHKHKKT